MIPEVIRRWGPEVESTLDRVLPPAGREPRRLHEAMRYSVLAGGKRLRPIFALAAYEACGGRDHEAVLPCAAALELLHTYSLIHDDLPSMDDDALRRGKPTCHVVFGEALAILAGDALQTLGAYLLVSEPAGSRWATRRNRASREILWALGSEGMAGGQAMDLEQTGSAGLVSPKTLVTIHGKKTGRFLRGGTSGRGPLGGRRGCPSARFEEIRRLSRPGIPDRGRHPGRDAERRGFGENSGEGLGSGQGHLPGALGP